MKNDNQVSNFYFARGAAILALAALVSACGGGSGSEPSQQQQAPTFSLAAAEVKPFLSVGSVALESGPREAPAGVAPAAAPRYLTPALVRSAYGLTQLQAAADANTPVNPATLGAGQTIAIISAYHNPKVAQDLAKFSQRFGLPACAEGCFSVAYTRNGVATDQPPAVSSLWSLESSMDVQWAHAIAPLAKIVLVEAASSSYEDVLSAANYAATTLGADVVSMSFGGSEWSGQASATRAYFANTKASFVAASGDYGHGILYPAASPHVLAVGGTTLSVSTAGTYQGEVAWSGSGGGLSAYESALPSSWPSVTSIDIVNAWHTASQPGGRPVPDVAYNADPGIGFFVYSESGIGAGYYGIVGGTSAGAPQWAGLIAIANAMRLQAGKAAFNTQTDANGKRLSVHDALAQLSAQGSGAATYAALFNDVTERGNGECGLLCRAAAGWDLVTGIGTPNAAQLIPALVRY